MGRTIGSAYLVNTVGSLLGPFVAGFLLLPLVVGVGLLFFDARSVGGWILSAVGAAIIVAGILMNMHIWFRPTSLYNTLAMLVLLAGGLGLIARSLKAHGEPPLKLPPL